jgi:hypothetical protein
MTRRRISCAILEGKARKQVISEAARPLLRKQGKIIKRKKLGRNPFSTGDDDNIVPKVFFKSPSSCPS